VTLPERLCESLHDLADAAQPADLHDGAVRRARAIARRETAVGAAAALAALALLVSGLWMRPDRRDARGPSVAAPPPAASSVAATVGVPPSPTPPLVIETSRAVAPALAPKRRKDVPQSAAVTPAPQSRSLADLPGEIFYQRSDAHPDVVRLSPADGTTRTVLAGAPSRVGISPDGARIAYEDSGTLLVVGTDGGDPIPLATGVSTADQAPAWSPDGDRILVATTGPAILQVGSGTVTPLPGNLGEGLHFRWSGDGSKLVYATAYCTLQVAGSDGDFTAVAVPMLGVRQPVDNPDGLAACEPTSVDATGDRVTVPLSTTAGNDGSSTADAVVDTATGALMAPPVAGTVVGTAFHPRGNLLVRTVRDGRTTLSLFTPAGRLLVQATEPAALEGLDLLAYTR
jgi:TolB protein